MSQAILTVLGKDKPGIIAKVTGVLSAAGCNLEDVSMTILEGQFAMIVIVDTRNKNAAAIRKKVENATRAAGLSVYWKNLTRKPARGEKHAKGTSSYIVSIYGRDRTGIVHQTSRLLAGRGLNITDLNCKILGKGKNSIYLMVLEVDVPKSVVPALTLKRSLEKLATRLKVDLTLIPVEKIEL